jgi:inhibitor of cysteine peptidase
MRFTRLARGALGAALGTGVIVLASSLAQAAPGGQAHAGSGCGPPPQPPAVGQTGTSEAIDARVGQPFSITLDSNPTTGYSWGLALPLDENVVELLQHTYQRSGTARLGAGGTEIWTFEPLCEGFTTIVLKYRRPWEPDNPNDRQVAYDVYIR